MPPPSPQELIHAYRHLYRALLHAVQFSKPARFVVRDQLRTAFRRDDPKGFNQQRISNTLVFLDGAARERGLEHRILRNLIYTSFYRTDPQRFFLGLIWSGYTTDSCCRPVDHQMKPSSLDAHIVGSIYKHYDMTIAMLNDSMGLCLR